jgi:coproporphyrinogen III oxidase
MLLQATAMVAPRRRRACWLLLICLGLTLLPSAQAFTAAAAVNNNRPNGASSSRLRRSTSSSSATEELATDSGTTTAAQLLFGDFAEFLKVQQKAIIAEIEGSIERTSGATFSNDTWGVFAAENVGKASHQQQSGGITRVIQGGSAIEKGACSLTLIRDGVLTAERAATIRARQTEIAIQAGDTYSAVALSMVLHSQSPMVPTFRSDVRVFLVTSQDTGISWAWFGGGADLTPYYLFPEDIRDFHGLYQRLCAEHVLDEQFSYEAMKEACDQYFYLPARQEHRGTGGIFFDDLVVTADTLAFTKGVTSTWMPSWLPIVAKRNNTPFTAQQKQWQKLRRGRYLEFNLLYDVCTPCIYVSFGAAKFVLTRPTFSFLQHREASSLAS